jgi:hypothetical protein
MELVLYCSADGRPVPHSVLVRKIRVRVFVRAGESWARPITELALSRRKQTLVMTSH